MANKFRKMVSLKKKRFQEEGFDLDLAYITERIVAFGYPAAGHETIYRNPKEECIRFFDTRHGDHYMIYNLCAEPERQYKARIFHDRVAKFQFYDHNAPPLRMMPAFCEHAAGFLNSDPANIVGVHCKAGKGRTGVMICCLLVYLRMFPTVDEAMQFYGNQRTHNGKGVTIPSQKRYIRYFHQTLDTGIPQPPMILINSLLLETVNEIPDMPKVQAMIECITNWTSPDIPMELTCVYTSKNNRSFKRVHTSEENKIFLDLGAIPVCGDVKVCLFTGNATKKERMCWFWINSAYLPESGVFTVDKSEIDKAVKDSRFPADFRITMRFSMTESSEDVRSRTATTLTAGVSSSSLTESHDGQTNGTAPTTNGVDGEAVTASASSSSTSTTPSLKRKKSKHSVREHGEGSPSLRKREKSKRKKRSGKGEDTASVADDDAVAVPVSDAVVREVSESSESTAAPEASSDDKADSNSPVAEDAVAPSQPSSEEAAPVASSDSAPPPSSDASSDSE